MSDGHGKEARAAGRVKLVIAIVKADSPFALRLRVPVTTAHLEVAGKWECGRRRSYSLQVPGQARCHATSTSLSPLRIR